MPLPALLTPLTLRMLAEEHAARLPACIAHVVRPFAHTRPDGYPDDVTALRLSLRFWLDRPSARITASERAVMRDVLALVSREDTTEAYVAILAPLLYRRSESLIDDETERERVARRYDEEHPTREGSHR